MASREPKVRPKVGVGVMITRGDKILLGKRKGAHGEATYGWAGGHVEFGETLEETARREVFEETGLEVIDLEIICVNNIIEYNKHYVDVEFRASVKPGEPEVREPDKLESWGWYSLEELPNPLFRAVELALKCHEKGIFYDPDMIEN